MTFSPILPLSGHAGWAFLTRTRKQQQEAFVRNPRISRLTNHFRESIGGVSTAEELVADRQLREVALGAFGLSADVNNTYFIERVLTSELADPTSLANRLADKRYFALARAFDFSAAEQPVASDGFVERTVSAFKSRSFESAVGEVAPDLRLAMSLEREITQVVGAQKTSNGRWYAVMSTPPLRKVFETALGLPTSFGALDIDRQLDVLSQRASDTFGAEDVRGFLEAERLEDLRTEFLTRAQVRTISSAATSGSVALTLLQASAE